MLHRWHDHFNHSTLTPARRRWVHVSRYSKTRYSLKYLIHKRGLRPQSWLKDSHSVTFALSWPCHWRNGWA
jgi:hypothetical protein